MDNFNTSMTILTLNQQEDDLSVVAQTMKLEILFSQKITRHCQLGKNCVCMCVCMFVCCVCLHAFVCMTKPNSMLTVVLSACREPLPTRSWGSWLTWSTCCRDLLHTSIITKNKHREAKRCGQTLQVWPAIGHWKGGCEGVRGEVSCRGVSNLIKRKKNWNDGCKVATGNNDKSKI